MYCLEYSVLLPYIVCAIDLVFIAGLTPPGCGGNGLVGWKIATATFPRLRSAARVASSGPVVFVVAPIV